MSPHHHTHTKPLDHSLTNVLSLISQTYPLSVHNAKTCIQCTEIFGGGKQHSGMHQTLVAPNAKSDVKKYSQTTTLHMTKGAT